MPKVEESEIQQKVDEILYKYHEDRSYGFYDWYVIGGRYEKRLGKYKSFKDIKDDETAYRVIYASERKYDGKFEAEFMIEQEFWNGTNFVKSTWNGNIKETFEYFKDYNNNCGEEYIEKITPKPDWLAVTVDYHC